MRKVRSQRVQSLYKSANPYCEACARLDGIYPVRAIELHHIYGGNDRTDEVWNLICICHEHHERATTHSLQYGSKSAQWNRQYLAIKYLKGERNDGFLAEHGWLEGVVEAAHTLRRSASYRHGIALGWFDA